MAALPPEALDFGGGEALNADPEQGFANGVDLGRLDDRHNHFHGAFLR
jgi:hypothetical protein